MESSTPFFQIVLTSSVVAATITAAINIVIFRTSHNKGQYEFIENQIFQILKIQLENPHFRDNEYCDYIIETEGKDHLNERRKYDAYCCVVWNALETMYEKYGEKKLKKSTFYPALVTLAQRHQKWLYNNGGLSSINQKMVIMLLGNKIVK